MAAAIPIISAVVGVAGGMMQANQAKQQADATASILEYNASVSRADAQAARDAAASAELKLARAQAETVGKQKGYYAKAGFTQSGTPLAMMADTVAQYAIDRATTLWNGEVAASKNLSQANIYNMSADSQRKAGVNASNNAMLSGIVSSGSYFRK